jgi:hypothetical protein
LSDEDRRDTWLAAQDQEETSMKTPDSNKPAREASTTLGEPMAEPTVVDVLRIDEPADGLGRRHVVVRWSDGTTGRALSYYADEILVSEGDLIGKTVGEIRALHFGRDRDYLQRGD